MTRSAGRAFGALLALAVGLVAVAACGVPNDSAPRLITAEDRALQPVTTTTAPPDPLVPSATAVTLYVLDPKTGRLRGIPRTVTSTAPSARVEALLQLELTPSEQAAGLITLIPPDTTLLGSKIDGFELEVNLSKDFGAVTGEVQTSAVAQLVYTATETRDVVTVRFAVEGRLYDVPGQDGVTKSSLSRSDFRTYDPDYAPPTDTTTTTTVGVPGGR